MRGGLNRGFTVYRKLHRKNHQRQVDCQAGRKETSYRGTHQERFEQSCSETSKFAGNPVWNSKLLVQQFEERSMLQENDTVKRAVKM